MWRRSDARRCPWWAGGCGSGARRARSLASSLVSRDFNSVGKVGHLCTRLGQTAAAVAGATSSTGFLPEPDPFRGRRDPSRRSIRDSADRRWSRGASLTLAGRRKSRHVCTPSQVMGRPIHGRVGSQPRTVACRRVVAALPSLSDEPFSRLIGSRQEEGRAPFIAAAWQAEQSDTLGRV